MKTYSDLVASTQEKLDSDVDFQASLEGLTEEDKTQAIEAKRQELLDAEVSQLAELADKATKAEEVARNQKIRAEKAEAEAKKPKKEDRKEDNLSIKDWKALQDVPEEDIDEVMDFAKYKGVSIAEAKANPVVQTILKTRLEERKTAQATATGASRKTTSGNSTSDLLRKIDAGTLSDSEMPEARKLAFKQMFGSGQ